MASYWFYEPFYTINDFDRLFDEAFANRTQGNNQQVQQRQVRNGAPGTVRSLRPRMDVHEDANANLVTATFELPGLTKENVNIDVHNNILTISGESKLSSERDENGYAVRERRYGKFSRSVPLPQGTKSEEIKAAMQDGVLTVTFPKTSPEQAPKKIAIA